MPDYLKMAKRPKFLPFSSSVGATAGSKRRPVCVVRRSRGTIACARQMRPQRSPAPTQIRPQRSSARRHDLALIRFGGRFRYADRRSSVLFFTEYE